MPENLSRNIEAEDQYRAAWLAYRETYDDAERLRLQNLMDSLQPAIATGPKDPRWVAFADSLPGFRQFWDEFLARTLAGLRGS